MALKKAYLQNKSAYHEVTGILITKAKNKLCIQTKIYTSKKARDSGEPHIVTKEYQIKQAKLIDDSKFSAVKYYESNDKELLLAVNSAIEIEEKEKEKKLSHEEKLKTKNNIYNELISKKAELVGSGNWNHVLFLLDEIVKSEYEILKMLSDFSGAEEI